MDEMRVYRDPEGLFELTMPDGWESEPDEEAGGVVLAHEQGVGLLHVLAFERDSLDLCDPADELYSFLEDMGIELEEDEVEDLNVMAPTETALSAYVSEDEDEDGDPEPTYWLHAVACMEGKLVFATYTCPAEAHEQEGEEVRAILRSIR